MRITARGKEKEQAERIANVANTLHGHLAPAQIVRTRSKGAPTIELMVDPQQLAPLLKVFYTFSDELLIDTNVFL